MTVGPKQIVLGPNDLVHALKWRRQQDGHDWLTELATQCCRRFWKRRLQ